MVGHFDLIELNFFRVYSYLKPHILLYSNGQAIWHGLADIKHVKVNYGSCQPFWILTSLKISRAYSYLKPHILFYIY